MWEYHDQQMKKLKSLYQKTSKQTQNRLQELIDTFNITNENLYSIASIKDKTRINNYIEEWKDKELLKGYFGMLANNIYRRSKVKNSEILELLIYSAYIEEQAKLEEHELSLFKEDVEYYYNEGINEVRQAKGKKKKWSAIPNVLFLYLLAETNALGYTWEKQVEQMALNNANQLYRQAVINIMQQKPIEIDSNEFKTTLDNQIKQKININGDKISGSVDMQLLGLNNMAKIKGIESENKDAKVRFISVIDAHSTKMCEHMNNMTFSINKENSFDRYWGESPKELTLMRVKVKGLVLGVNLPPINHHVHFCRSTIVYNTDYTSEDFSKGIVLGEEQQRAIDKYLKSSSYKINSKLYNSEELSKEDEEFINRLDEALKGMPIYKGWVNRSVHVQTTEDVENILSIFNNEQKTGHWASYTSSSLGIYDGKFKMIMKIKSKTGRNLSALNDEGGGEILFMRNTDFQLLDIKKENDIIYVKLEEV